MTSMSAAVSLAVNSSQPDRLDHSSTASSASGGQLPSAETIACLSRLFDLNFKLYNKLHVMRRVQQSMVKLGVNTLETLESKLQGNREARCSVFNDVIAGDTSFFRDQREFEFFKSSVAPQILRRSISRRQPARIWICGCSTGEEVYSMAMVLCEVMDASDELRNATVRLFATDINEELLKQARLGEYADPRCDSERLSRFFTSSSNKFRASQRLRNMIMFGKHDVLRQTPYMNVDLLCCRNISLMLTPEGRGFLFATAHEALQDSGSDTGFLWLGTGEEVQKPATEAFRRIDPAAGFWRAINLSTPARSEIFGEVREAQLRSADGGELVAAPRSKGGARAGGGGGGGEGADGGALAHEATGGGSGGDSSGLDNPMLAEVVPWANPVLATLAQHMPYILLDDDNKIVQSAGDMRPFTKSGQDVLGRSQLVGDLLLPELVGAMVPLVRHSRESLQPAPRKRVAYKVSREQLKATKAAALAATREAAKAEAEAMALGGAVVGRTPASMRFRGGVGGGIGSGIGGSGMSPSAGNAPSPMAIGGHAAAMHSPMSRSAYRTPVKPSQRLALAAKEREETRRRAAAESGGGAQRAVTLTVRPVLDHSGGSDAHLYGRGPGILVCFEALPDEPAGAGASDGPALLVVLKAAALFVATGCVGQMAGEQLRCVVAVLSFFTVAVFLELYPNPLRAQGLERIVVELEKKEGTCTTTITALNVSLEKKAAELANVERDCSDLLRTNAQVKAKLRTVSSELLSSNEELSIVNSEYVERIDELRDVNLDIENLLASTKIGVVFLDETLSMRKFTTAMTAIVPLTQQDVGRKIHVFNFDFGDEFIEVCEQVLTSTLSRHIEVLREVTHEDNTYLMRVLPYESGTGKKMKGVVATFLDISDRVLQKRDYERLIETANAPIFGSDMLGDVNEWNLKAAEITGFSQEEVLGRNLVEEFITAEYRAQVKAVLDQALAGDEAANFEFPLITKSGKRVEVLLNATSRRNAAGDIIGVVGIGQDITKRKETESKLDLVAKDLTNLIDTANAPIFGIDQKGRVNEWNQKATEITEFTKEEVMGRNLVQEFITSEYRTVVKAVLDGALAGKVTANFEFPLYTKSGRRLQVLLNANPRRDTNNEIYGVVGVGQDITERIAQEQEYVRLIDTANAPIFGIDRFGNVNVWNKTAVSITKYSSSEVMGHNLVQEFITPDFRKAVKAVFDKALMGEEAANFEFPLLTKDGKRIEVLLNATSRRDVRSDIIGVVGIGQDITGRKETESKLDLVAKDLTNLIDTANAPIFGIDQLGRVNEWNQKAGEITEYSKEEVLGRNLVEEFITPEFRSAVKAVLDSALFGKMTANFEFPLYTKSGRRLQVLLNANPRRDTNSEIVGVVGVGQDITERIAQEQEYVRLIDTANAPIFGIDGHGNVNVWNKKAVEITGFSTQEVMGHNLVMEFITPDFRKAVKQVLDKALLGEEAANFEFPLITKDGKRVEVLLNATSRRDARGDVMGVVGIGQDITGRKTTEASLKLVANDLTNLIDTANAPIFGIDQLGRVNEWNQKAAEITEYSKDEVMGRNLVQEFITPEYRTAVKAVLDSALFGKATGNFEFPLYTKGGRRLQVLLNANPRRDTNNEIVGVVGVGQDITERIAQEQEYVRLIDTANAPIFGIDREGNVNVWNRKAVEITMYSVDEVMGHNLVQEFITPDFREAVKQVLDKALAGEETANFEFPLITKDGKRIEVLLNATSRQDATNDITGVMGIGQDITQFLTQQQEYTRLIENANAPIFGVARDGRVNIWNQKIAQITGFSAAEVMGRNLVEHFIRPSEKHAVTEVLDLAINGTETDSFELPLQTQGKELVTLLLNASSKMDNAGQITGVVGVGQDFTARKKMEQTKTAFLASFSHELRTPLNGLLGMLELLLEQKLQEVAHRQVTLARTCSTLLLNLINDILDLSKIEAGQLEISWQPFNLCSALEGAAQLVRMQAEARGIDLVVDIRSVPQIVVGDGLRLRQVVLNLLSNAIKFTKEGTIWVRCFKETDTETNHMVRIEVEDTGVGMHASDCAKLFTLFTKISDKRVANPAGSGLGLAICKQLVTLMGGVINVTSEYGSGSKFAFSVNFRRPTAEDVEDGTEGANNQVRTAWLAAARRPCPARARTCTRTRARARAARTHAFAHTPPPLLPSAAAATAADRRRARVHGRDAQRAVARHGRLGRVHPRGGGQPLQSGGGAHLHRDGAHEVHVGAQRPARAGHLQGERGGLRPHPHGLPDAHPGRLLRHARHPRVRGGGVAGAHPHRRPHRLRHVRRPREVYRRGHGRLPHQADRQGGAHPHHRGAQARLGARDGGERGAAAGRVGVDKGAARAGRRPRDVDDRRDARHARRDYDGSRPLLPRQPPCG